MEVFVSTCVVSHDHSQECHTSTKVQGQPGLQSEFQDSQDYTEKPCLEKTKKRKKKKKEKKKKRKKETTLIAKKTMTVS